MKKVTDPEVRFFLFPPIYITGFSEGVMSPFFCKSHKTQQSCHYNTMANTNTSDTYPSDIFTSTCNTYFEHIPYPWQSAIWNGFINYFLITIETINKLCFLHTGGGKTLLSTTISTVFKGATLCINPILSIGDYQSENLNNRVVAESWLTYFHLGELDSTTMTET